MKHAVIEAATVALVWAVQTQAQQDGWAAKRRAMVEQQILQRGITDKQVVKAMRAVPRHELVPAERRDQAYGDHPVSIGFGQTISQPYIVAYMTEQLDLTNDSKVLEIGTGSGYQAAVLAEITPRVFTMEIIPELAERAAQSLERLGYGEVRARQGDGYYGWPSEAPFDAIVVTAAAEHVPPPLVQQLKPGGVLCVPVGSAFGVQYLLRVNKQEDGAVRSENLMPVRFVPLTGEH